MGETRIDGSEIFFTRTKRFSCSIFSPLTLAYFYYSPCISQTTYCFFLTLIWERFFSMTYNYFYISFVPCYRFVLFCPYLPEASMYHTTNQKMCKFTISQFTISEVRWGVRYDILIVYNFVINFVIKLKKKTSEAPSCNHIRQPRFAYEERGSDS